MCLLYLLNNLGYGQILRLPDGATARVRPTFCFPSRVRIVSGCLMRQRQNLFLSHQTAHDG